MPNSNFVFTSQSGCLLPMLIMLNLFFGKLIFSSTRLWLGLEGILILLFIIKIHAFTRKIWQQGHGLPSARQSHNRSDRFESRSRDRVVDVEGEVVEEQHKLK